jgi:hypothetical protein
MSEKPTIVDCASHGKSMTAIVCGHLAKYNDQYLPYGNLIRNPEEQV